MTDFRQLSRRGSLWALLAAAWVAGLVWGVLFLWRYASAAGAPGAAAVRWPEGVAIERVEGASTLVLLLHPKCPCSRASVEELRVLMARSRGRVQARVLLYYPDGESPAWARTGLWKAASAIPGVRVFADGGGRMARLLGAETSGQALIYDAGGALVFAGGLTGARGHAGDNPGLSAALESLAPGSSLVRRGSVFGCALTGSIGPERAGGKS